MVRNVNFFRGNVGHQLFLGLQGGFGIGGEPQAARYAKHVGIKKDESSPAIEPNEETVVKGTYPIWRRLYVYINPALDRGAAAAYIKWMRSDEGQKVVKDVGYFPLPPQYREK